MIDLRNKDTGEAVGSITEEQLQFMVDQLEEDSDNDRNYWLNRETLDMFAANGGDTELIALLTAAMGDGDDIEVEW